jgi:hypothetical protein
MKRIKDSHAVAAFAGALLIGTLIVGAQAQPIDPLPEKAVPLTAFELRQIYNDKTWKWNDGGARFIGEGRRLIAFSEGGGYPTFAEGNWAINNKGRLCMVANWVTKDGEVSKKTCFRHVRDRGTIYQRREPDGNWYVFKTYKIQSEDEYNKLVSEDTISPNVVRLKQSFQ